MTDIGPDDVGVARGEKPEQLWQFSLSHLFVAMIPVGLLFACLGTMGSTTWLQLLLVGLATAGYLAIECLSDHRAPASVPAFWRASYFVARAAAFHETCFFLCLISLWCLPAPRSPPASTSIGRMDRKEEQVREALQPFAVLLPYATAFVVTSIVAWIASAIAADRVPRAGRLLAVTTLPGLFGGFVVWFAFFR